MLVGSFVTLCTVHAARSLPSSSALVPSNRNCILLMLQVNREVACLSLIVPSCHPSARAK